jgi:hypothetical protein
VALQDFAILRPLFLDHPVWKADVFASKAYQAFAARVTKEAFTTGCRCLRQSHAALQQTGLGLWFW